MPECRVESSSENNTAPPGEGNTASRATLRVGLRPRLTYNLCNHPAWALSDVELQKNPAPLHIGRVREDNHRLFRLLDSETNPTRRGEIFHQYLSVQFALHQWPNYRDSPRRSLRNSYVRFLRG